MKTNLEPNSRYQHTDVLVVGGTPAGCTAAIAAARAGKRALILEPTPTLGGLLSNGVSVTDTGSLQAQTGIFEEFVRAVQAHYLSQEPLDPIYQRPRDRLLFEPHVSGNVWKRMVEETDGVDVIFGAVAVDVVMDGRRIKGVVWENACNPMGELDGTSPQQITYAHVVIDATYEGDIAAWSGAPWRLGREARSPEEPHAGIIYTTYMGRPRSDEPHDFPPQTILPGSTGEADDNPMASNCRLTCKVYEDSSPSAPHRLKTPPDNYDPSRYHWPKGTRKSLPFPGGKTDLNVLYRGNDFVGPVREYVLAHPRERAPFRKAFIDHALGFLYYLQTEGGLGDYGLADDEFIDNGHAPYQIYVREGRRIEGLATLTESNINPFLAGEDFRPPLLSDSIAVGDYQMDSKICRDARDSDNPLPEGAFFFSEILAPFQLPFGCMVPRGVEGLLVPVAVSATHVAFSALRMEPVWAVLGQAAGEAAVQMIERGVNAADVAIAPLQEALVKGKSQLTYFSDVPTDHRFFEGVQWAAIRGVVPRDETWQFTPDAPISYGELAWIVTRGLQIPVSVTGRHFFKAGPSHTFFRYLETLYDTGSRAGIHVFPGSKGARRLELDPDGRILVSDAVEIILSVWKALGRQEVPRAAQTFIAIMNADDFARRAEICQLLCKMVGW